MVLGRLLIDFSGAQLKRLVDAGRLSFCPEVTAQLALRRAPAPFSRPAFIRSLDSALLRSDDRSTRIVEAIDAHLLVGNFGDFGAWRPMHEAAVDEFHHVAGRDGYEYLMPPDSMLSSRYHYRTGLETGLARVNDLIVAGVPDM